MGWFVRAQARLAVACTCTLPRRTCGTPPRAPATRRFIRASRPDAAAGAYRLATAFPPKPLDDDSATIEAAGLANSVVVQK